MPRPRTKRHYDEITTDKICDAIRNGESLQAALTAVDYLPSDHYRLMEAESSYKTEIESALRDRSSLLLDSCLAMSAQLDNDLNNSVDIQRVRQQFDIIKTVALAHDNRLRLTNNQENQRDGAETWAEMLTRLESKSKGNRSTPSSNDKPIPFGSQLMIVTGKQSL